MINEILSLFGLAVHITSQGISAFQQLVKFLGTQ